MSLVLSDVFDLMISRERKKCIQAINEYFEWGTISEI